MTYNDWLQTVARDMRSDSLWQVPVYQHSLFLSDLAWFDCSQLAQDPRTIGVSEQLYQATGKISSYIAQGYSHANGYEGAYFYDSALGASRAARNWYYASRHILAHDVVSHRLKLINHIIRQLFILISQQRGHQIREEMSQYDTASLTDVLNHVPMGEGLAS